MSNPEGQHPGLPRSGTRNDQGGPLGAHHRFTLYFIQIGQIIENIRHAALKGQNK
jgi:hypothetical protein